MKALILSCNTGQGHNSCSAAIKECFEAHGTVCDVTDALGFISQGVSKFISKGHVFVYRHMPWLFRRGYRYSERHGEYFGEESLVYRLMARGADGLYDFICREGYDTVICPHVFSALMLTELLKRHPSTVRSCFVDTDYVCHPGAAESALDLYFMPDASIMEGHEAEFDMTKVVESGIPVRRPFYSSRPGVQAKRALGIPEDAAHLLVMCGSMGCGPMKRLTSCLAGLLTEKQYMTVVCGTNHALKNWLDFRFEGRENIRILGYTQDISLLMDSADLYLTKPGGISTSEAAVKALPMVLVDAVAGCEEYNMEYYVSAGLAVTAEGPRKLARLSAKLLGSKERLARMQAAGRKLRSRNGAELIYSCMNNEKSEKQKA